MKHKELWRWLSLKIVFAVAAIEALFVLFETLSVIHCHYTSSECWPFFFVMVANLPASIGIFKFVGFFYDAFHIESFWLQTSLMASSFLIIGTLWWSMLTHIPVLAVRLGRKWQARTEK